jgi:hypothetical protein
MIIYRLVTSADITSLGDSKAHTRKQSACVFFPLVKVVPETFYAENVYPIIMISSSPTSLITMYNVRRFLQESMHVLPMVFPSVATD